MKFKDRLKEILDARDMKPADLANITGIARSSISDYLNGRYEAKQDKIDIIASKLGISPAYLMGWEDESKTIKQTQHPDILPLKGRTKRIPLLGEIACGEPIYANREYELYEEVDETLNADFCLKAKGDSMINARIYDGDIVFIKECQEVYNGEIAAVIIEDSVTLKRVFYNKEQDQLVLNAENTAYAPLVYRGEQLNQIRILGLAVGFQSVIK